MDLSHLDDHLQRIDEFSPSSSSHQQHLGQSYSGISPPKIRSNPRLVAQPPTPSRSSQRAPASALLNTTNVSLRIVGTSAETFKILPLCFLGAPLRKHHRGPAALVGGR